MCCDKNEKYKRKIRQDGYGYAKLSIPTKLFRQLAMKLNQEVIIERIGNNVLGWELRIHPTAKEDTKLKPTQKPK